LIKKKKGAELRNEDRYKFVKRLKLIYKMLKDSKLVL